jgi:hypothetical protein
MAVDPGPSRSVAVPIAGAEKYQEKQRLSALGTGAADMT